LIQYGKNLSLAIGFPLTPYFGSKVGEGDAGALKSTWLKTSLALQVITLALPIAIFFLGEPFITLWIGHEYAIAGRFILYILLIGLVFDGLSTNAFRILTAQAKHGRCAIIWLILSIVSIPIGIFGAYRFGLEGAVFGTTLATVLASFITLMMACSTVKISIRSYFSLTVLKVFIPLLLLTTVLYVLSVEYQIDTYFSLIIHIFVAGLLYAVSIWFFTLNSDVNKSI